MNTVITEKIKEMGKYRGYTELNRGFASPYPLCIFLIHCDRAV